MRYYSAWVTITGKVFVSEDELVLALGLEGDEEKTASEKLADVHPERLRVAFTDKANDKIREHFPTDEPVKLNEVEIDSNTLR